MAGWALTSAHGALRTGPDRTGPDRRSAARDGRSPLACRALGFFRFYVLRFCIFLVVTGKKKKEKKKRGKKKKKKVLTL